MPRLFAPSVLLFGSVRWADWRQSALAPETFVGFTGRNIVDFSEDTFTYNLGLGYQFSDAFSGAVSFGYEAASGREVSSLGPSDGRKSIGLGGTYSFERGKLSGSVRYTDVGDATTRTGGDFTGNSAWTVGVQYTYALK